MWINHYEAQWMMEERVKDALREAERVRLIRAARGHRNSRGWRQQVALIVKRLLAIFADDRVAEPRRQPPSTAPSPTSKGLLDSRVVMDDLAKTREEGLA